MTKRFRKRTTFLSLRFDRKKKIVFCPFAMRNYVFPFSVFFIFVHWLLAIRSIIDIVYVWISQQPSFEKEQLILNGYTLNLKEIKKKEKIKTISRDQSECFGVDKLEAFYITSSSL